MVEETSTTLYHHRNAFHTTIIIENSRAIRDAAPECFELDLLIKGRPENAPSSVTSRGTWLTWAVEACFEYCRIAWDILPNYEISLFGCGEQSEPITIVPITSTNSLVLPKLRNLRVRMLEIAKSSQNPTNLSVGLNPTPVKNIFERLRILESEELITAPIYQNNLESILSKRPFFLRIILMTTETDEEKIEDLIRISILDHHLTYLARFEVAVIIIGNQKTSGRLDYHRLSGYGEIFIRWYNAQNGSGILDATKNCITRDLRLSRTIVTDIPMKEDAKSGGTTSFSYDVELFHPCLMDENRTVRPGGEMLRMKWVKPIRGPMPGYCPMENTIPIRASASDPTTRPTQCLVGYVVDGNAIFLESKEPPVAGKLFLCGGKICLQQLVASSDRSIEDFSALAELPGGRVGSYRVKEAVSVLSFFPLDVKSFPIKTSKLEEHNKMTAYFPLVYSETIVFLLPQLIGLFDVLNLVNAPEDSWVAAREAIEEVLEMEKKAQALPVNAAHVLLQHVSPSNRKAESYAVLWAELDMILESNSVKSSKHMKLWTYYRSILRKSLREDIKVSLRERLRSHAFLPSSTPNTKILEDNSASQKRKSRPEFEGRVKWGRYGKLYQNLQKPDKNDGGLIHASFEL